jgi:UDP-N-acetylmuramoyl-tripeptide--D-alanyl-D-alanine ligase
MLGGKAVGSFQVPVTGWALDHRAVKPGDAFIAIKGSKFDGHDVAEQAVAAGAVVVIAERTVAGPHILVVNLVMALARMAGGFRHAFHGEVIGVTGSAGKTTTKELIAAALQTKGPVLKTTGNRNTEYTAPLLWTELEPEHKFVVMEMAMRGPGQIEHLASFSDPTIGLVTNIGYAHLELLGTREAIARAKGELLAALDQGDHAVVWDEDPYRGVLEEISQAPVLHFGFGEESACQIGEYVPLGLSGSRVCGNCLGERWEAWLPTPGRHLALNAAAAILVGRLAGVPSQQAAEALANADLPPMRMEVRDMGGITVLLDAYNASPSSMEAALETLSGAPIEGAKIAVVGDMRELGDYAETAHRELAALLLKTGLAGVIAVGEWAPTIVHELEELRFGGQMIAVPDAMAAKIVLSQWARVGDAVLVKGSRSLELERVVQP